MNNTLTESNFNFPHQTQVYKGKVRDVYTIGDDILVMVASDRISAFDVVLPKGIPFKGQILNEIATKMMDKTKDIVPNWLIASPDPNVAIGKACQPFKVEMVIRAYLTGHAWRTYKSGSRTLCGVTLPEGLKEHDAFKNPIITPATKADKGLHDEDISKEEIIAKGIVSKEDYEVLENYTYALFKRGTQLAKERGLILVDTKYEFGKTKEGEIVLIDEIHTPDSSRYFYLNGYHENQEKGWPQKQLSKEFVREWLIQNNFQGLVGQNIPVMTEEKVAEISKRYIELYEQITGESFIPADLADIEKRIENNTRSFLVQLLM